MLTSHESNFENVRVHVLLKRCAKQKTTSLTAAFIFKILSCTWNKVINLTRNIVNTYQRHEGKPLMFHWSYWSLSSSRTTCLEYPHQVQRYRHIHRSLRTRLSRRIVPQHFGLFPLHQRLLPVRKWEQFHDHFYNMWSLIVGNSYQHGDPFSHWVTEHWAL